MDISINLASQPYEQVQDLVSRWRLVLSAVALLAMILLVGSIAAVFSWRTTQKQAVVLTRQIQVLDRQQSETEAFMDRAENRQLRMRAEFLNAMIARKAFSWTEVFTDLEHIMPARLRVTSIHPEINADDQLELHLAISGSARDAGIELLRQLEQSQHFIQAQMNSESILNPQSAQGDSIQYHLSAIYIPAFARGPAREQDVNQGIAPQPEAGSGEGDGPKEARNAGH